ncbi:MAG: M24 family metallopeptidase [Gammaproteobacteria bacterium]
MPAFDPRALRGRARFLPSASAAESSAKVDLQKLYAHRLGRLRAEMAAAEMDGCVLFDAVNIRYATGARNMQIFTSRNPASRYAFIPAEGAVVLFEFPGCAHLAAGSLADEIRPCVCASAVAADSRQEEMAEKWADEIADLARRCGKRLGIEAATVLHWRALEKRGFQLSDAQRAVERARAQKSAEEIQCVRESLAATDAGVEKLRAAIRPGMSENALWALLHESIIAAGGDYVETRLMASGARTNPWFQECSARPAGDGELVALDTDVVGPFGYYADYSRTFYCGKGAPSARQRTLYGLALEQIRHNAELLKPGMSFREIAEKAWQIPDEFAENRYFVLAHGVGMTGEYPYILHRRDFDSAGYDGVLRPMTTLCLESYIGGKTDAEGVKLEQQVLVGDSGCEVLSRFPFEESLTAREF